MNKSKEDGKLMHDNSPEGLLNKKSETSIILENSKDCNKPREKWGNEIEFLFSCIALSVGLGNVWRFPFIALENGGGAFLIPYIIVLILIGRPVYYMEVIIGQFSSRGCIKAFDLAPIMRGCAYGQVFATAMATTYYASIMGLTIKYLIASISSELPWAYCKPEFGSQSQCIDSARIAEGEGTSFLNESNTQIKSSAELYFIKSVLHEKDDIENGIGLPNWELVACLFVAWCIIGVILSKGIQSSGKASYFLASFPYCVMLILLTRAVTLPGSMDGILYFLKPQWNQLLNPKVWYAAITQMFFSLAICFGTLIMYASYNKFDKNIYKDVIIITTIDSFTSIMAGCVIFGILGNLAFELKINNIKDVIKGGAGLAFISYPDAIAKFTFLPQVFSVLFFSMLLVLGIGSNIGMASCVMTVIKDKFTYLPHWLLALSISLIGFLLGTIYMTPGGQFILNLVDFFGCSFIGLVLAICELIAIGWIYGVKRFCKDIEFMFGIKTGIYWRICWGIITPTLMTIVLVYMIVDYTPLEYKNIKYPSSIYGIAWIIFGIGVMQLPFWAFYDIYKQPGESIVQKIKLSLQPTKNWGPKESHRFEDYIKFRSTQEIEEKYKSYNLWSRFKDNVFG